MLSAFNASRFPRREKRPPAGQVALGVIMGISHARTRIMREICGRYGGAGIIPRQSCFFCDRWRDIFRRDPVARDARGEVLRALLAK